MKNDAMILIACEESGVVVEEFVKLGYENVYSCDILPTSGNYPNRHIQGDVLPLLDGCVFFTTMDGVLHTELSLNHWDMIIAFPPCTYLTVAGNRWFDINRYGEAAIQRHQDRERAIEFFVHFVNADCEKIIIENPVGVMSRAYRKPDQIIQPFEYGHPFTKQTCLWLKGVPPLVPTGILVKPETGWENQQFTKDGRYGGFGGKFGCKKDGKWLRYGDPDVKKARSKTFPGIARAMAEQWGGDITHHGDAFQVRGDDWGIKM